MCSRLLPHRCLSNVHFSLSLSLSVFIISTYYISLSQFTSMLCMVQLAFVHHATTTTTNFRCRSSFFFLFSFHFIRLTMTAFRFPASQHACLSLLSNRSQISPLSYHVYNFFFSLYYYFSKYNIHIYMQLHTMSVCVCEHMNCVWSLGVVSHFVRDEKIFDFEANKAELKDRRTKTWSLLCGK